ncbi:3-phenylpropionate/trans-cinnamate dioxygenase ferredoxin reductase subunit [Aurantimicrobium minutum]|uniref:NAD(P)/FAD-dependent oxidoreductase n=1 Tax=Aurantimicrobium minutum TaxID=708131 RepID=UPI00240540AC|nr:NAD(P)/FAD-dependent oxidoreductase [Aurantimicrobium minutum]MDF9809593.1 3-phenylpropionate/trans-cinnamate dioxygenase ferredoxin reductase subunit [Aurantimicrobium minutum]
MIRPVVIVGASMGGLRAAETLRKSGYEGRLVVIGDEPHAPYNRPPLSKEVLAEQVDHAAVAFPMSEVLDDVEWILGNAVVGTDLDSQTITLADGQVVEYNSLIIASGLRPRRLDMPGQPARGAHAIRTLDDAMALRPELKPGAKVVVYGAGFIGCEAAATATKLGATVTVVGKGPVPMLRPLGQQLAEDIQRRHEAHGVRFVMNTYLTEILGDDSVTGVVLDNGETLECDVLIESIGSLPNTEFLEGNDIDIESGVQVNAALHALRNDGTPWANVFAIGDVARFPIPQFDPTTRRVEHWNIPTEMARKVGKQVALQLGDDVEAHATELAKNFAPIPSFWSDQFEVSLLAYGLLDQGTEVRLLEGQVGGDCIYGYYRGDDMVGVCGIGMRSKVMGYRNKVGLTVS